MSSCCRRRSSWIPTVTCRNGGQQLQIRGPLCSVGERPHAPEILQRLLILYELKSQLVHLGQIMIYLSAVDHLVPHLQLSEIVQDLLYRTDPIQETFATDHADCTGPTSDRAT